MDRPPLPPPFDVGTRLRYVGTRECYFVAPDESRIPYIAPGLEVTVCSKRMGRRGTLQPLPGIECWEEDMLLDTTRDGYSTYDVEVPGDRTHGRIIWPADAHEWEVIPKEEG